MRITTNGASSQEQVGLSNTVSNIIHAVTSPSNDQFFVGTALCLA